MGIEPTPTPDNGLKTGWFPKRRGIGTALHQELKAHIPREVAFVGRYALLDSPVTPFLEKIGYIPGKQYLWFDRYA